MKSLIKRIVEKKYVAINPDITANYQRVGPSYVVNTNRDGYYLDGVLYLNPPRLPTRLTCFNYRFPVTVVLKSEVILELSKGKYVSVNGALYDKYRLSPVVHAYLLHGGVELFFGEWSARCSGQKTVPTPEEDLYIVKRKIDQKREYYPYTLDPVDDPVKLGIDWSLYNRWVNFVTFAYRSDRLSTDKMHDLLLVSSNRE